MSGLGSAGPAAPARGWCRSLFIAGVYISLNGILLYIYIYIYVSADYSFHVLDIRALSRVNCFHFYLLIS